MAERFTASPRAPISGTPVANNNVNNNNNVNRRVRRGARVGQGQADNTGMIIDETGNRIRDKFFKFLSEFQADDGTKYYLNALDDMEQTESTTMNVDWNHLIDESASGQYTDLSDIITEDYYRFEPYLRQSISSFVRENKPNYIVSDIGDGREKEKEFYVSINNFSHQYNLRELTTNKIGQLCTFAGTITRTSQVRPELIYGTFECELCNKLNRNVIQQFKYTLPTVCESQNPPCGNRKQFKLDISRSKFIDWQKCRVQENSSDIPAGSMPRSIDVILRNEQCEKCKPGDNVFFTGTLIVVPIRESKLSKGNTKLVKNGGPMGPSSNNTIIGLKAQGIKELNYKLVFLANNVNKTEKDDEDDMEDEDIIDTFSAQEREDILRMKATSSLYQNLTLSIAPNIYGHEEIKRGILLQLFGGVHKSTIEGNKLRGDLNICIIGDPSTAKSQFLKFVTEILPSKTVYTSGKASSAAGLTAAVMRDRETGEMGIEAGALMLADNGICCIDEFDKMDEIDQTAIHEAMEQQTITITKAGIHCSLNARASILAACNPIWGRYDTSKPIKYNISMSAPIMSRFDLFFVVLDECDEVTDYHVAKHIISNHQKSHEISNANASAFSIKQIQNYLRYAKTIKPIISEESKKWFVRYYRQLRQRDQTDQKAYRFTVRQLESLIRLSEALARLHCDQTISPKYVKEAARLLKKSIISVDSQDIPLSFDDAVLGEAEQPPPPPPQQVEEKKEQQQEEEEEEEEEQQEQLSINYNTYMQTANFICCLIRRNESQSEAGIKQTEIKNLYMKEKENEISDDTDMEKQIKLLKFIIHRLIEVDHILLIKEESQTDNIHDRILIVHPNYDPDSRNTANLSTQ